MDAPVPPAVSTDPALATPLSHSLDFILSIPPQKAPTKADSERQQATAALAAPAPAAANKSPTRPS